MSKIEVNQISSQCGSTLTIGQSGDTVTLAAGATQSGFGRSGSVNWDTTAKTTSFTAVSGNGYFVNTTSGAITVTLPASPSAGDIVAISDYARTFATNNVTVARNGSLIQGVATDGTISTNGQSTTFVYVDGTKGWVPTEDQTTNNYGFNPVYIVATGGTVTTCGNYKIHTFTSPGTFTVCSVGNPCGSTTVDYLVVAGGGGSAYAAGSGSCYSYASGGGGAGGFRQSSGAASGCYAISPLGSCVSALPVSATGYPITVGGGGSGGSSGPGSQGSNSVFSTITSTGGGYSGTGGDAAPSAPGGAGGSGGGAGAYPASTGGAGNTPPVSPPQGSNGAAGSFCAQTAGGGGGGATAAGSAGTGTGGGTGGDGGTGATTSISGSSTSYSGGGGGGEGFYNGCGPAPAGGVGSGDGGTGGGGAGGSQTGVTNSSNPVPSQGIAGTTNTGGGGGGTQSYPFTQRSGNAGGSGIVIIRYRYQ